MSEFPRRPDGLTVMSIVCDHAAWLSWSVSGDWDETILRKEYIYIFKKGWEGCAAGNKNIKAVMTRHVQGSSDSIH